MLFCEQRTPDDPAVHNRTCQVALAPARKQNKPAPEPLLRCPRSPCRLGPWPLSVPRLLRRSNAQRTWVMAGTAGRGACVVGGRAAGQQQTRVGLLVPGSGHRAICLDGGVPAAELSTPRNVGGSRRIKNYLLQRRTIILRPYLWATRVAAGAGLTGCLHLG